MADVTLICRLTRTQRPFSCSQLIHYSHVNMECKFCSCSYTQGWILQALSAQERYPRLSTLLSLLHVAGFQSIPCSCSCLMHGLSPHGAYTEPVPLSCKNCRNVRCIVQMPCEAESCQLIAQTVRHMHMYICICIYMFAQRPHPSA